MTCTRCLSHVSRCPGGLCWCKGWHHTRDGLALCPDGNGPAWPRIYDVADIGPGPEYYRERELEWAS